MINNYSLSRYRAAMSNPNQPYNAGDNPYQSSGQGGSGGPPGDPFAAGQPGGYQAPQGGYPGAGQPYPGGGYGNYPGGGQGSIPPQPATPNTVTYAFWCWIAATVVSLISLGLTLVSPIWDEAAQAARRAGTNLDNVDVAAVITTLKVVTVVVAVVFVAVYLLFAFKMKAGRNWARIVLTVFGALTVLSAFTASSSRTVVVNGQSFDASGGLWAPYLTGALAAAGIVLMFLAPSNAYFAESKRHRQAKSLYGG